MEAPIKIKEAVKKLEKIEKKSLDYPRSALERFPFLILSLSTFGVVAVLYGFEKIIDSIPWFADKPLLILGSGFAALVVTGTLFKKL